ncbi:hypothetical protein ACFPOD_19370 [Nitratireductor kimnyeongensis]|uniref:Transposase n=1 Tax=Nitratireductor kimnyeongensis TaxID=430679 RepID=A0ABW0TEE2_9HYPH|nr:hypothetical protein [Nitratireductor kimnyeongensis]
MPDTGKARKAKRPSRMIALAVRRIAAFAALIRKDNCDEHKPR